PRSSPAHVPDANGYGPCRAAAERDRDRVFGHAAFRGVLRTARNRGPRGQRTRRGDLPDRCPADARHRGGHPELPAGLVARGRESARARFRVQRAGGGRRAIRAGGCGRLRRRERAVGRVLGPALRAAQRPRRRTRRSLRVPLTVELVEEEVELAPGLRVEILRPPSAEELIDEAAFDEEEFLPYWAELWPSGLALARHVAALELGGLRVIELGCGLGLPALSAALRGADVLATDWAEDAIELLQRNAERNGLFVRVAHIRWSE